MPRPVKSWPPPPPLSTIQLEPSPSRHPYRTRIELPPWEPLPPPSPRQTEDTEEDTEPGAAIRPELADHLVQIQDQLVHSSHRDAVLQVQVERLQREVVESEHRVANLAIRIRAELTRFAIYVSFLFALIIAAIAVFFGISR